MNMNRDALYLIVSLLTTTSCVAIAQPLAFTDVTVVDVEDGSARPDMTVVVTGDRITDVGPTDSLAIPSGAAAIDAKGKYLIPGLWDMHVHLFNQVSRRPPNEWYFPLLVANGVTGVREMWTKPGDRPTLADWRARAAAGALLAPRIAVAGTLVDGPASLWPTSDRVATAAEGRSMVREIHDAGLDFVKVYDMLPREAYFAIMDEARRLDLHVAGHIPTLVRAEEALAAGQRTAEHLVQIREACSSREDAILRERTQLHARPYTMVEDDSLWERHERIKTETFDRARCMDVARRLATGSMWQVPTLVNERRWYYGSTPEYRQDARLRYVPAHERKVWQEGYGDHGVESDDLASMTYAGPAAELARRWAVVQKVVDVLGEEGVPILAGTDLGGPYVYPGFSLHDELALLVEAGLSPLDALRAATLNPARFLGATDSLGTIAPGRSADLVLLDGNPLEDIRNTRRINAVVIRGRLVDRSALDELLAGALVGGPATAGAQAAPTAADSAEILGAIANWERAWKVRDAALAAQDYSDDADWTNAFGMRRIGRDSIRSLLEEVFDLPFVMAGNTEYEYHDLRFVGSDVALLRSRAIRAGQQLPDGTVQEDRRINHLRVFERRDGRWSIISHLIGDERTPGRPR